MIYLFFLLALLYGTKTIGDAAFAFSTLGIVVVTVIYYVIYAIGSFKMYSKANVPGWYAFIPFVDDYQSYKIAWNGNIYLIVLVLSVVANVITQKGTGDFTVWTVVAMVFSLASLVLEIKYVARLAKSFGKGTGFAVGLFFLRPFFVMALGFDDSKYQGPQA